MLAEFAPPPYRASVLRGREGEAAVQFRAAMAFYQQGHFADAVPELMRASADREDAAYFWVTRRARPRWRASEPPRVIRARRDRTSKWVV
ncbi:MAG: hypothetical protein CK533_11575 [Acidobacterium sp.]|nr:MAG: hypothetical protein CK533_11575 [Acidobacterium sp.]